jgi:hypothetical protein
VCRVCLLKGAPFVALITLTVLSATENRTTGSTGVFWSRLPLHESGYTTHRELSHMTGAAPARTVWFGRTVTLNELISEFKQRSGDITRSTVDYLRRDNTPEEHRMYNYVDRARDALN